MVSSTKGSKARTPHLLVFGYGYSAHRIGKRLLQSGWLVSGTRRSDEGTSELEAMGVRGHVFDGARPASSVVSVLNAATHLLVSIPPDDGGDPVLSHHRPDVVASDTLEWIGYLSTTGVYGDRGGAWVDERTPPDPSTARSRRRRAAERAWTKTALVAGVPLQIFRLSGIYGPDRSVVDRLRAGTATRLVRAGLVFNRIHVDDVAGAVLAGIDRPEATGVFNVSDNLPSSPQDVLMHAAGLLGVEPPPERSVDEADLSPVARSFYSECKRVSNDRLKADLRYRLRYPTYREGLAAVVAERVTDFDP